MVETAPYLKKSYTINFILTDLDFDDGGHGHGSRVFSIRFIPQKYHLYIGSQFTEQFSRLDM